MPSLKIAKKARTKMLDTRQGSAEDISDLITGNSSIGQFNSKHKKSVVYNMERRSGM